MLTEKQEQMKASNERKAVLVSEHIEWCLPQLLKNLEVTPYRLSREIEQDSSLEASRGTIYRLVKGESLNSIDLAVLVSICKVLSKICDRRIDITEIIRFKNL